MTTQMSMKCRYMASSGPHADESGTITEPANVTMGPACRTRTLPAAGALLSTLVLALIATLLPATVMRAAGDMGVSPERLTGVASWQFTAFFVCASTTGLLENRLGRRVLISLACLLLFAGGFCWGYTAGIGQARLGAVLWGCAGGILGSLCPTILCDLFPQRRKLVMNLSQILFTAGAVGGPWLAGSLLPLGVDWRLLYIGVGCSGLSLVVFYWLSILPKPTLVAASHVRRLRSHLLAWSALGPCLVLFLYVLAESTVMLFANQFLRETHQAPEAWAIYSISFFWGAMMIGRLLCALIPERISYTGVVAALMGLAGLSLVLQAVAPGWRSSFALFALCGFACSGIWPLLVALAGTRAPDDLRANLIGITIGSGSLGCIAAPPLMRELMDFVPQKLVFPCAAIPFILGACLIGLKARSLVVSEDGELC